MRKKLYKNEIKEVTDILINYHNDARCELNFTSPYELLISTILSAQCTDVRVNKITKKLFEEANTPQQIVDMGINRLSELIKTAGFYNVKSKNIIENAMVLIEKYNSNVPDNLEDLIKLPGVGRKTANVVLSNCYNIPAIAVDTHVFRVSNRIGIVNEKNVHDTEQALMRALDKNVWTKMHHVIIFHGRRICKARNQLCLECPINNICLYFKNNLKNKKN